MSKRIELKAFNPTDETHIAQIKYQRILCGWGVEDVDSWCESCTKQEKYIFWIFPSVEDEASFDLPSKEMLSMKDELGPISPTPNFKPLGHIALDWIDLKGDQSLADRSENRASLATFFILKSQQGSRLGSKSMDQIESIAANHPFNIKELTLNTLSANLATSPAFYETFGFTYSPTARVNEYWYVSRGFVPYKRGPRYEEFDVKGNKVGMDAVFMRKDITSLAVKT